MRWPLLAVWLPGLLLCGAAQAACDTGLAERMHAKLHPERVLNHELAVCEPWRGAPGRSIVVLPLPRPGAGPGVTWFDLDVLVIEQADNGTTERARIASRRFEKDAVLEEEGDANHIATITADTARYALAPDARAFGLRLRYQASSRASPSSRETLTLYLPRGQRLIKVLDRLEITGENGEWDASCAGAFSATRGTLSVMRSASNGLADLMLQRKHSGSRSMLRNDECVNQELKTTLDSAVLRYDGAHYHASRR
jgi:hypothetical protein